MTPEEKEVEQLDAAYQDALIALGLQVVGEMLNEWAAVTLGNASSLTKFTAAATALIVFHRKRARALSVAHTRLSRALVTGATISDSEFPGSGETIGSMRRDFTEILREIGVPRPLKAKAIPDDMRVDTDLESRIAEAARDRSVRLDDELGTTFNTLLRRDLDKKFEELPAEDHPNRGERLRELDLEVGARIASAGERIALNGARENDADVIQFDRKALGWVRVHDSAKADHPCGFCSMLLTRGFLSGGIYTSEKSALQDQHGSKYHTNCHCVAVKIWRASQLDSPRFEEHRKLAKEWERFTAKHGRSGDDLLRAWDKHIRSTKKVPPNDKSSPAPRGSETAQEAAA